MTEDLAYQDQSASILRLNLVQGSVDKSNFNVLCTGGLRSELGNLELGIIGASHYFDLTDPRGNLVLTEVFACVELNHPHRVIVADRIQRNIAVSFGFPDFDYRFNLQLMNWNDGKNRFFALRDSIECCALNSTGLSFEFPGLVEFPSFLPVTLVEAIIIADGFEIETLHAYPNENKLVFTKTTLLRRTD